MRNTLPIRTVTGIKDGYGGQLTTVNGGILHVQDDGDSLPDVMMAIAATAKHKTIVRGIGGVAGLKLEERAALVPYFLKGFKSGDRNFQGVISSGGTAEWRYEHGNNYLDPSIVQVAAAIGAEFGAVVIHTTPQTSHLQQHREDGRLVMGGNINDKWTGFDPRSDFQLIIRPSGHALSSAWDLDTPHYRRFMANLAKLTWPAGGFMFNGGLISLIESIELLALKMPIIPVRGSGRECDALIKAIEKGDYSDVALETKKKLESRGKPLDDYVKAVNRTREVLEGIECTCDLVHIANFGEPETFTAGADKFGWLAA